MLKQSQKRTKRAALPTSRCPERRQHHRLVGDEADGRALDATEARDDVLANASPISKKSPSSDLQDQLLMSYGLLGSPDERVEAHFFAPASPASARPALSGC